MAPDKLDDEGWVPPHLRLLGDTPAEVVSAAKEVFRIGTEKAIWAYDEALAYAIKVYEDTRHVAKMAYDEAMNSAFRDYETTKATDEQLKQG